MNKTAEAAMLMSSLSVYKGILGRTVPWAFYRLLCAAELPPREFLEAWGSFTSVLMDRGYMDSLAKCLSETALFDENIFSRTAAAIITASSKSGISESHQNRTNCQV